MLEPSMLIDKVYLVCSVSFGTMNVKTKEAVNCPLKKSNRAYLRWPMVHLPAVTILLTRKENMTSK